jgi:hypothetical protein
VGVNHHITQGKNRCGLHTPFLLKRRRISSNCFGFFGVGLCHHIPYQSYRLSGFQKPACQTNVLQGEAPFKLIGGNMGAGLEKSIPMEAGRSCNCNIMSAKAIAEPAEEKMTGAGPG